MASACLADEVLTHLGDFLDDHALCALACSERLRRDRSAPQRQTRKDEQEQIRATVDGLRAEAADHQAMVHAVQGALECREVRLDLERARMHLEDARSRLMLAEMP